MLQLLLAVLLAPVPEQTYAAVVVRCPASSSPWLEVTDDGESTWFVTIVDEGTTAKIVWHLDSRVMLPRSELRPGTRIRLTGPSCTLATRIEVVTLGPLAMEAAVEEWVIDQAGGRLEVGLTASELATVAALGSPSWLVRDAVSWSLRERGPRALRLLLWSRRARDAEVRARAEGLLSGLGWEPIASARAS